ncbi:hypothetical protein F5Y16DRAFT_402109 [Xylariaceae sp. FL0255]|nr:hypothetical protein F5Y16DRAFT_402109 [Xylariaceae sp. FL0255]
MATANGNEADFVGYSRMAYLMAVILDTAIFRKFRFLSILNLLRLQSELKDLENQLEDCWNDEKTERQDKFRWSFRKMRDGYHDDPVQYELLEGIGEKLEEDNKTLRDVTLSGSSAQPDKRDMEALKYWITEQEGDPSERNQFLQGNEAKTWKISDEAEYLVNENEVANRPRAQNTEANPTKITNQESNTPQTQDREASPPQSGDNKSGGCFASFGMKSKFETCYEEKKVAKIGDAFVATISAVLPTVVILVHYFMKSLVIRLGLVVIFTSAFAVALATFTNAKRIEIFSATAAFAAVEVVFVGSTSGSV